MPATPAPQPAVPKPMFNQGFAAPVAPTPQPAPQQQHTFEQGFAVPATPAPVAPVAPAAQQPQLQASQIVGQDTLNLSSWLDGEFEKTPHLPDDSEGEEAEPPPHPTPVKHKHSRDPYVDSIRQLSLKSLEGRIYHRDSQLSQQVAQAPSPASAQDHEMTLESPPQNGGNGNFANIFAQAPQSHVNVFGQTMPTSAQPSPFAATPIAFGQSSPAPSLFFPASPTAASAPPAPFLFSPAPAPATSAIFSGPPMQTSAPSTTFSASPALFSFPQKEPPASSVSTPAFSVAAPAFTAPTPAQSAAVSPPATVVPASSMSTPIFSMVASAPAVVDVAPPTASTPAMATPGPQVAPHTTNASFTAMPSNAGRFLKGLPAHSLRALEPKKYPPMFSEKQRYQFRMAFKLLSLEAGLQKHLDNNPGKALDSDRIRVYKDVQAMILEEAARLIPGTRKRTSDDDGQMNGYLGETKRQEVNNHSFIPTQPANPPTNSAISPAVNRPIDPLPATPVSSGNKKRKADEQITKDTYDANGSVTTLESAKKDRQSAEEGVSYPKLPSPKSTDTPGKASSTAQLFQNLANSPSAKEAMNSRSMGPSTSFQSKASTFVGSTQKDSPAAFKTGSGNDSKSVTPAPIFGGASSFSVSTNAMATATNQSPSKIPSSGSKPSFQFGTSSTNITDKPTGSVPKFGESASDASQKAAFQVPSFGASSSSIKDKPAGAVPKSSEPAGDVSQKPTFQVPKFGNPTNFLDAFSKKAATDEKKEKAKRKADEFDSDEDNEEEWERQDAEKQAAKKQKVVDLAKDEFKFKMPTAMVSGQKATPLFSVSGSTIKSPTKNSSAETTVDTPTTGRSLFDRVEKDNNGDPKGQLSSPEKTTNSSTTSSAHNIFGASNKASSNIFGASTGTPSKVSDAASNAPSTQKTPEKKRLGGFGTPNANPEAAKLFNSLSGSPNAGDNTWNPETPIKFGASQAAPAPIMSSKQGSILDSAVTANPFAGFGQKSTPTINITAATPTPTTSSKQTSIFDSVTKPKPFTGFSQNIFGSAPTTSSTAPTSTSTFGVGFNFGAPPTATTNPSISNLAPSNNASAATSRGTTPDTGNTTDEEALQDEQIDLANASKGEELEEVIFDCRARIQELTIEVDQATKTEKKKYETRAVGPLRLLKHKESGKCRLVGRIDASGRVVINAGLMPSIKYEKVSKQQVKFGALNLQGKLSTWVVLFKEAEKAEEFAKVCEESKGQ